MLLKNQRGLGLILEIIIVAVVVTVIGAIGFKVNQARTIPSTAKSTAGNQTLASQSGKYLSIDQWGVRLAADPVGDLAVDGAPQKSIYSGSDEFVNIKSLKLSKIWQCMGDDKGIIGSISKSVGPQQGSFGSPISKTLGKYTYSLNFIQNICSTDKPAELSARDQLQAVFDSLDSITASAPDTQASSIDQKLIIVRVKNVYSSWLASDLSGQAQLPTHPDALQSDGYLTSAAVAQIKQTHNFDLVTCSQQSFDKGTLYNQPEISGDSATMTVSEKSDFATTIVKLNIVKSNGIWQINSFTCPSP